MVPPLEQGDAGDLGVARDIACKFGFEVVESPRLPDQLSRAEVEGFVLSRALDFQSAPRSVRSILLSRCLVKGFATDLRGQVVRSVLAEAKPREKKSLFADVARLLRPELSHPTLGAPPGSFFDPYLWPVESVSAPNTNRRILRLAAFVAGMLYQEEGIQKAGRDVTAVARAIVGFRGAI
ncbi:MAG: hypothetical protein ACKVXR_11590 [Planctomycetota bacterium]